MYGLLYVIFSLCLILNRSFADVRIYQKTVSEFVKENPATICQQCTAGYSFFYKQFPLYSEHADIFFRHQGIHPDLFILSIPDANAYFDQSGYVYVNNTFIKETQIKNLSVFNNRDFIDIVKQQPVRHIQGKVAVVNHLYPYCYGLWIFDVLSQLALLERFNVEYDYLCIPYYLPFMADTLDLWGIDRAKIIPLINGQAIQADQIIMTTSVSQDPDNIFMPRTNYYYDFLLMHIREKLIAGAMKVGTALPSIEKIFISRKDAGGKRATLNEDEVYEKFKSFGYQRFCTAELSMAEKILLFYNARSIISFVGSGSTNILFSQPGSHYIEITQTMVEATFFFIADMLKIRYSALDASKFEDLLYGGPWSSPAIFPLGIIDQFIQSTSDL